jgi:hypothetical protein
MGKYRKAIAAITGAALEIIPLAFPSAAWAAPAIAVLTALAVYLTPNAGRP